jgi:hypothetical protein
MANVQLRERATVVLDINGNGTAKVGPLSSREIWHPQNVAVSVQSPVSNEASCKIYVGDQAIDSNFRDGTFSGSSGDSTDKVNSDTVKVGQYVWAIWSGGDSGMVATLNVTGNRDV